MTVASEIEKLQTNLTNAYTKAEEKGATLPTAKNFDNLATTIESITSGGGGDTIIVLNKTGTSLIKDEKVWITYSSEDETYFAVKFADITKYSFTGIAKENVEEGNTFSVSTMVPQTLDEDTAVVDINLANYTYNTTEDNTYQLTDYSGTDTDVTVASEEE